MHNEVGTCTGILPGNLLYKCSIQKKRQIQLVVRDRMNSICPVNFFRTTDATDTTIWKPGFTKGLLFVVRSCYSLVVENNFDLFLY